MNEKICILIQILLKVVPKVPIEIGLDNGSVTNMQQAIICTNADPIFWCIYAALGGDELKCHLLLSEPHHSKITKDQIWDVWQCDYLNQCRLVINLICDIHQRAYL